MLVKIQDFPDDLAERLKRLTGEQTASKSVLRASLEYESLLMDREELQQRMVLEQQENQRLRSVIEAARSSAAQLLERTGQADLFGS